MNPLTLISHLRDKPVQPALPKAPRDHDLPPRWDGHTVEWQGWRSDLPQPVCAKARAALRAEACPACGHIGERPMNRGIVRRAHTIRGGKPIRRGISLVRNLFAFRCQNCCHDQVLDNLSNDAQWWDLDDTDYTDQGSYAR